MKIYKLELRRRLCRVKEAEGLYNKLITDPVEISSLAGRLLKGEAQEVFLGFYFNTHNRIIGYTEIGRGGFDACPVDPKVLFSSALLAGATAIILVHNHPSSGNPVPSPDDIALTERVDRGSKLLGMVLMDHLVIGDDGSYVSLAERGLIPKEDI